LELLDISIHLRGLISLLEVLGDLKSDFGKELWGLLLFGRKLVEEVLGLS